MMLAMQWFPISLLGVLRGTGSREEQIHIRQARYLNRFLGIVCTLKSRLSIHLEERESNRSE